MDTFKLKLIAICAMLIDHIGIVMIYNTKHYGLYLVCRGIGRIAFPIFAFLITEGFTHTSDIKKYLKRIAVFALISEIPFDLAFYQYNFNTDAVSDIRYAFRDFSYLNVVLTRLGKHQNVFFTLFLGLALITLFHLVENKFNKNTMSDNIISNSLDAALTVIFCILAFLLHCDYSVAGILIIAAFYLFKESKALMAISLFIITTTLLCDWNDYHRTGDLLSVISILATLSVIFIAFYNGKKGKDIKYFFYIFYPVHLFCLFIIGVLIQTF